MAHVLQTNDATRMNSAVKQTAIAALLAAIAWLAWLAWQTPKQAVAPATVQRALPTASSETGQPQRPTLWRVVTRRVISKEGMRALQRRLLAMGLKPIILDTTEDVTMHAFDDSVLFKTRAAAARAARFWQQHGIETNIIRAAKGVYLLGLGRLYQAKYAASLQQQLEQTGRKYRYQQRIVPIPVRRFTFAPRPRAAAEALWQQLNETGVMMPSLISERAFRDSYGKALHPRKRP